MSELGNPLQQIAPLSSPRRLAFDSDKSGFEKTFTNFQRSHSIGGCHLNSSNLFPSVITPNSPFTILRKRPHSPLRNNDSVAITQQTKKKRALMNYIDKSQATQTAGCVVGRPKSHHRSSQSVSSAPPPSIIPWCNPLGHNNSNKPVPPKQLSAISSSKLNTLQSHSIIRDDKEFVVPTTIKKKICGSTATTKKNVKQACQQEFPAAPDTVTQPLSNDAPTTDSSTHPSAQCCSMTVIVEPNQTSDARATSSSCFPTLTSDEVMIDVTIMQPEEKKCVRDGDDNFRIVHSALNTPGFPSAEQQPRIDDVISDTADDLCEMSLGSSGSDCNVDSTNPLCSAQTSCRTKTEDTMDDESMNSNGMEIVHRLHTELALLGYRLSN
jgi:hypothetical protein